MRFDDDVCDPVFGRKMLAWLICFMAVVAVCGKFA